MSISDIAILESLAGQLNETPKPRQEYYMIGSIVDTETELLLHRLQALCDYGRPAETFRDHEIVFRMPRSLPQKMQMTLRVRKALDRKNTKLHVCYLGQLETGDRSTSTRTRIDFMANEAAVEFLATLGFDLDYDFIAQGYIFRKGFMKITLSRIYKTSNRFVDDVLWCGGNQTPVSHSYLVELSVLAKSGLSSTVGQNMKQFAESLMPLVKMGSYGEIFQYARSYD